MPGTILILHVVIPDGDHVASLDHLYEMAKGLGYKYHDRYNANPNLERVGKTHAINMMMADVAGGKLKIIKAK
jgi:hypothetical protein